MSRSRKKNASGGMCRGCNTEYYRDRNRSTRAKNRNMLRTMLANMSVEQIADVIYHFTNRMNVGKFDAWNEPTDGTWHARTYQDFVKGCNYPHYENKDFPHETENRELTAWRKKEFAKRKRK